MSQHHGRRVLFVVNPRSGKGRAAPAAALYGATLRRQGFEVEQVGLNAIGGGGSRIEPDGARAVVVFGGDGTVHSASPFAARIKAPIYQVPFGTENLFARAFGMNRSFERLRSALLHPRTRVVDTAVCAGRPMLLMCSAGPDASIVHRLAARRNGSISHLSYLAPIVAEAWSPALSPVTVRVDGVPLVEGRAGTVVVANFAQYAMRLNPARGADPADGLLDAVFLPASSALGVLAWSVRLALGIGVTGSPLTGRGRRIEIQSEGLPVQIDGEAPRACASGSSSEPSAESLVTPVTVEVRPASLEVLLPPTA